MVEQRTYGTTSEDGASRSAANSHYRQRYQARKDAYWYTVATYAASVTLIVSVVLVAAIISHQRRQATVVTLRQASNTKVHQTEGPRSIHLAVELHTSSPRRPVLPSGPSFEFSVENRYGKHIYMESAYPWLSGRKLLEPYMETTLSIQEPTDGVRYRWALLRAMGDAAPVWTAEGSSVTLTATTTGRFIMVVRAASPGSSSLVGVSKEVVYVKYVRREMRSLLKQDLDAFLDAARSLWDVSTQEGQALYGQDFLDIDYFAGYHLTQSADPACDHMHDGMGFLTQHAALTLKFEKAIQAVDPSVSVPYWDYTIDGHLITDSYDGQFSRHWFDLDVFADDVFGRSDPNEHYITSGRWAKLEIRKSVNSTSNAYGLMRSPWNTSKRKYLTRASTFCGTEWDATRSHMPTCADHYNAVAGYNSYSSFVWYVPYAPHGTVHSISGGTYGCEGAASKVKSLGLSDDLVYWFSLYSFSNLRRYYRMGLYECPSECADETPQEECTCTCPGLEEKIESGEWQSLLELAFDIPAYLAEIQGQDNHTQIEYLRTVCNAGVLIGDHLEASSAFDISFWPIHPTIERLWQWKKLQGMFSDETWPSSGYSIYGDTCSGHRASDVIPIPDLLVAGEDVTNAELYDLMDPSTDALPFIFDTFEWAHCTTYGIDFHNLTRGVTLDQRTP